ncbi:hypothetical protein Q8A67_011564 [Cirrhinus molitorella]|uniref:Uncharacterized protein n=1 Tax=Cirrhinus molitorella TaxID=172907 RepID=A0AA88PXX8_9TELE|nr:hypothetical protein Q8A67_011564 [Cirrhinus molitorella]
MISAWKSAICEEYTHVFKEGIGRGGRLTICENEMLDTDNPILTITYYTKVTFLLQDNEASLNSFEEIFPLLKAKVEKERDETHVNCTDSEEEGPVNPTPSPSEHQLRDSLALLELDFTEFRERTQAKLPDAHNTNIYIQELKDELQQLKKNTSSSITELTRTIRDLQEENRTLRLQLCRLEEDTEKKGENFSRQLQEINDQLQKNTKDITLHYNTAPTTDKPNATNTECEPTTNLQQHRPHLPDLNLIQMFSSSWTLMENSWIPRNSSHTKESLQSDVAQQAMPTRSSENSQDTPHNSSENEAV